MDIGTALIHKIKASHILYLATFLFFVTFLIYANTLGNGLFFDDEDFIYKNVYVQEFNVPAYFSQNTIAGAGKVSNYYRPLLSLSYGVEYGIFKDIPFIYHFTNVLIQATAGIALLVFLNRLLHNKLVAFITSILFVIHPIQTEAVSYASGRSDPMVALFTFLTLIFFLKRTPRSHLISLCFFICALLSRETALITPGLLLLVLLYQTKSFKKTIAQIPQILSFILIDGIYFGLRLTVLNFQNTLNFYDTNNVYSSHIENRMYTFLSIIPTYFLLLVFPTILYMERFAPIITTPLHPAVIGSFLVIVLGFIGSIKVFKKYPVFLFSLLWMGITFIPTSGIIPINGIIYEHFLFLPSVGFFLLIAVLLNMVLENKKYSLARTGIFFALILILVLLCLRTITRNSDWHDPITFYSQLNQNNPLVARVHNNLAMAYADAGRNKQAIEEYQKAIRINDIYPQTHYNLGNSYVAINDLPKAETEYKKALIIDPSFTQPYVSLAKLYRITNQKKQYQNLLENLQKYSKKNKAFSPLLEYIKSL